MKLDVEFINPFLSATLKVLEIQASTKATAGTIEIKGQKQNPPCAISGIIGITAEAFNGSVVIGFPKETFLGIMSRMLGEEYTSFNKDIIDGAGELTNIIFGQAKVALNEKGFGIKMAIPSVISGTGIEVHGVTKGPIVVVPFKTDLGPFFIEISLS